MGEEKKKNSQDYINEIYDAQQKANEDRLRSDYESSLSELDEAKKKNQQNTDEALTRTAVEAQKANMNWNEVQNAYGLSSGANAQARLSRDNQLASDLTALRQQQSENDAVLERQRALLGQQYAAAISQAQQENDLARAQALYEQAQRDEAALLAQRESAASLMAQAGDFSLFKELYGLTDAQVSQLNNYFKQSVSGASGPSGSSKYYGSSGSSGSSGGGWKSSYDSLEDAAAAYVQGGGSVDEAQARKWAKNHGMSESEISDFLELIAISRSQQKTQKKPSPLKEGMLTHTIM